VPINQHVAICVVNIKTDKNALFSLNVYMMYTQKTFLALILPVILFRFLIGLSLFGYLSKSR
jgi:hypothetical protein